MSKAQKEPKSREKKVDRRIVYIMPSLLAMVFALSALAFQFGNEIVDLKNTCYTLFISSPSGEKQDEMIEELGEIIAEYGIEGYTILKNDRGGYLEDGIMIHEDSLQIILLNVSRSTVMELGKALGEKYQTQLMLQQTVVKVSTI